MYRNMVTPPTNRLTQKNNAFNLHNHFFLQNVTPGFLQKLQTFIQEVLLNKTYLP